MDKYLKLHFDLQNFLQNAKEQESSLYKEVLNLYNENLKSNVLQKRLKMLEQSKIIQNLATNSDFENILDYKLNS